MNRCCQILCIEKLTQSLTPTRISVRVFMSARNYPPGRDTAFELLCDCSIFNFERAIFDQSKWSRAVNLSKMPPFLGEKILWVYSFPGELNITLEQIPLDHAVSAGHIYTRWDRSRQLALLAEARVSQHITPPQGRNTSVRQIWVWGELPSLFLAISCHYRASWRRHKWMVARSLR